MTLRLRDCSCHKSWCVELSEPLPPVRLAMAWAMTHPAITSVLIGARHSGHIDNALEAFHMGITDDLRSEMSAWTTGAIV